MQNLNGYKYIGSVTISNNSENGFLVDKKMLGQYVMQKRDDGVGCALENIDI